MSSLAPTVVAERRYPSSYVDKIALALNDLRDGLRAHHIWWQFGWHDVKQRYRRSMLGPFWLTISTAVMVGAMGFLYARILHQSVETYLPYLAVGLIVWQFLSTVITDSCIAFIQSETLIRQIKAPITVHVLRMLARDFIIFLHQAVILVPIALLYGSKWAPALLWVPLAFIALLVNGIWCGLLLGSLCTRFRDIPLIVQNLVQILFFVSPILWQPGVLGNRVWVAHWNPVYHFLEIVREPILGTSVPWASWGFVAAFTMIGFAVAVPLFARTRPRIPFWV